jgi:pimeloyl-ACP methyl ester carboxylesterase
MPAAVVGHSFGGRVALAPALRAPAIRAVVSYEGAPPAAEERYQPKARRNASASGWPPATRRGARHVPARDRRHVGGRPGPLPRRPGLAAGVPRRRTRSSANSTRGLAGRLARRPRRRPPAGPPGPRWREPVCFRLATRRCDAPPRGRQGGRASTARSTPPTTRTRTEFVEAGRGRSSTVH